MSDIVKLIQEIAGTRDEDKVRLYYCEVNSVDLNKRTCNVTTINGSATITFDAQLTAGVADGFIVIPVIGSLIYVLGSKYTLPFVLMYSDIETYSIKGDEFGGLVRVIELTQKLNALEAKVNDLILHNNTHTHASNGTPTTSLITGNLTPTKRTEIENTSISHGQ